MMLKTFLKLYVRRNNSNNLFFYETINDWNLYSEKFYATIVNEHFSKEIAITMLTFSAAIISTKVCLLYVNYPI